jgi:glutamate racemase
VTQPDIDPAAPVLMFDSGVGGLTVLDALRAQLPDAPVIYAADLAGCPMAKRARRRSPRASRACWGG